MRIFVSNEQESVVYMSTLEFLIIPGEMIYIFPSFFSFQLSIISSQMLLNNPF